jgi:hypothetical protein
MNLIVRLIGIVTFAAATQVMGAENYAAIPFEERVQQAATVAANIRADGNDRDWGNYPARYSVWGNAGGDSSRDLISTRVLADAKGLYVCVRTRGLPSKDKCAFGFKLDFTDTEAMDVVFAETTGNECPTLSYIAPGKPTSRHPIQGVQAAVAECVEWCVPWESLAQALPEFDRSQIVGPNTRPWVRVTPYTVDKQRRLFTDYGARRLVSESRPRPRHWIRRFRNLLIERNYLSWWKVSLT